MPTLSPETRAALLEKIDAQTDRTLETVLKQYQLFVDMHGPAVAGMYLVLDLVDTLGDAQTIAAVLAAAARRLTADA